MALYHVKIPKSSEQKSKGKASLYLFKDTPREVLHITFALSLVARIFVTWPHLLAEKGGKWSLFLGQQMREIQGYRESSDFNLFI